MATEDLEKMMQSVVSAAIECLFAAPERRIILSKLEIRRNEGMSFSALKDTLRENPGTLNQQLAALMRGGLVENFLQRNDATREYSFYRLTKVGKTVLSEYELFAGNVDRRMRELSPVLGLAPRRPSQSGLDIGELKLCPYEPISLLAVGSDEWTGHIREFPTFSNYGSG